MMRRLWMTSVALVVFAGCGSEDPTEPIDRPPDPGSVVVENPRFSVEIDEIFRRFGCAWGGCHAPPEVAANLDLSRAVAYDNLVGVQAQSEDFLLVAPGDPDASYFVIKVEGRQSVGLRMPLVRTTNVRAEGLPLTPIDLQNVRNWIANGAPRN